MNSGFVGDDPYEATGALMSRATECKLVYGATCILKKREAETAIGIVIELLMAVGGGFV